MKNLVVARLIGGLGNQMFQYATGRALANKLNGNLKIDTNGFDNYFRKFDLHNFKIRAEHATEKEIIFLKSKNLFFKPKFICKEKGHNYNPNIQKAKLPVYLDGYWQSEKYFSEIRSQLLEEFRPAKSLSVYSDRILKIIERSRNSVSIHIRRGDYLTPQNQQVHGVCSLEYYRSAIQTLQESFAELSFFVFSDEINWAKANLSFDNTTCFVDENTGDRSFEDLLLMSACEHNIIANSSFSWWGAWLNKNPNKTVVAPLKWFTSAKLNPNDIFVSGWVLK